MRRKQFEIRDPLRRRLHGNQKEAASNTTVNVQEAQVSDEEMAAVADDSGGGSTHRSPSLASSLPGLWESLFCPSQKKKGPARIFWDENDWDDDSDLVRGITRSVNLLGHVFSQLFGGSCLHDSDGVGCGHWYLFHCGNDHWELG